jgi:Nucleoside-diphosphate-sugar epimerases
MHILLTGAYGNIGSSTLQELVKQGHTVRCFDIKTPRTEKMAHRFDDQPAVERYWADLRNVEQVQRAVQGQDIIIHFGGILPPYVDQDLDKAKAVNVGGTRNLIEAAHQQKQPPKFLFASSLDLFGYTQDQQPPRKVTDPVQATDAYTEHKIECEQLLKQSGLEWAIFRFADVPAEQVHKFDPIMFRIPLANRFEVVHRSNAALAVANGIKSQIWGQIWLIGGGKDCQVTYRDYLNAALSKNGIGTFPDAAFGHEQYCTDWLDTTESQALLHYQRHNFEQIMQDFADPVPVLKTIMPMLRPFVQRYLLKQSPYWRATHAQAEASNNKTSGV